MTDSEANASGSILSEARGFSQKEHP